MLRRTRGGGCAERNAGGWGEEAWARRPEEAELLRWSQLLLATTREEAERAAGDDPAMRKAAAILDRLQDDPQARQLAESLELARLWGPIEEAAQRAEWRAEVIEEGRAEGIEEGLRRAVREICEILGVVVPVEGEAALAKMDGAAIERLIVEIKASRGWPG